MCHASEGTLLKHLPERETLCIDLEAGLKSVQDWRGDSIPVRCFEDAIDVACLVGGVSPAAGDGTMFSQAHYQHLTKQHPDLVQLIAGKSVVSALPRPVAKRLMVPTGTPS
jgi:hypothetical protein